MTTERPLNHDLLMENMAAGWARLQAFIATLTPDQFTTKTDAAGWTVKDHLMHIAIWAEGIVAVLNRASRQAAMGIPDDLWETWDYDAMNAFIQRQHADLPLAEVMARLEQAHTQLATLASQLSEDELYYSYQEYQPDASITDAVITRIMSNSYEHYDEHIPWMQAIVG